MECDEVSSLKDQYIDGELDGETAHELEEHLSICPKCRAAIACLRAAVNAVQNRFARKQTPAYLRERIVQEIGGEPRSFWGRAFHRLRSFRLGAIPSLGLVGATIAALAVAGIFGSHRGLPGEEVEWTGQITCIDCALNAEYGAHNGCSIYGHRNGFRDSDGKLWTFMNNSVWHPYLQDPRLCGRPIAIRGKQYPEAQYIDLESYTFIGKPAATAPSEREAPVIGLTFRLPQHIDVINNSAFDYAADSD